MAEKTTQRCTCTHAKSRHRQQYGEPHTGACRDCGCQKLELTAEAKRPPARGDIY